MKCEICLVCLSSQYQYHTKYHPRLYNYTTEEGCRATAAAGKVNKQVMCQEKNSLCKTRIMLDVGSLRRNHCESHSSSVLFYTVYKYILFYDLFMTHLYYWLTLLLVTWSTCCRRLSFCLFPAFLLSFEEYLRNSSWGLLLLNSGNLSSFFYMADFARRVSALCSLPSSPLRALGAHVLTSIITMITMMIPTNLSPWQLKELHPAEEARKMRLKAPEKASKWTFFFYSFQGHNKLTLFVFLFKVPVPLSATLSYLIILHKSVWSHHGIFL